MYIYLYIFFCIDKNKFELCNKEKSCFDNLSSLFSIFFLLRPQTHYRNKNGIIFVFNQQSFKPRESE